MKTMRRGITAQASEQHNTSSHYEAKQITRQARK
jgi:hypothetical protein